MGKFSSMYYDREQDKIFAIPHNPSGGNVNMITQMTPDGVVEKTVRLDSPILLPTGPEGGVHLKIENGLALVVTPTIENHDSSDGAAIPQKMYVYKFPAGKLIKVAPVEFQ